MFVSVKVEMRRTAVCRVSIILRGEEECSR